MSLEKDFIRLVRVRLSDLSWTQLQFANKLGRGENTVNAVLNGRIGIRLSEMDRWCEVLGVDMRIVGVKGSARF